MSDPAALRARLLGEGPGNVDALVGLILDWLLARPVAELIEPAALARQLANALDLATRSDQTERWLQGQVTQLRARVPNQKLGAQAPPEVTEPLAKVLGRPFQPDRALLARLLDHAAVEKLMAEVLTGAIRNFAMKLRPMAPASAGRHFGALKGLAGGARAFGDGLFGGLSHEIEAKAEQKARDFVEGALQSVIAEFVGLLTSTDNAVLLGDWRAHMLGVFLDTPLPVLAGEIDKLDPEALVATGAAVARSFSRRADLHEELRRMVTLVLDETGGKSVGELLADGGIEEEWRPELEGQLVGRARDFVETEVFAGWLGNLLAEG